MVCYKSWFFYNQKLTPNHLVDQYGLPLNAVVITTIRNLMQQVIDHVDIYQLIESPEENYGAIRSHLDALPNGEHYAALSQLTRYQQRKLFHKCAQAEPLNLDYFLDSSAPPLQTRRLYGRNTLPLLGQGRVFEKRMCRPLEHDLQENQLYGYNHTSYMWWFGPGYFVARNTPDQLDWQGRGGVVIDYFQKPDGQVPNDWPSYRPNWTPPQALFYFHTRDFMRKVSEHVSIGVAYRNETCLDHYFILVKE